VVRLPSVGLGVFGTPLQRIVSVGLTAPSLVLPIYIHCSLQQRIHITSFHSTPLTRTKLRLPRFFYNGTRVTPNAVKMSSNPFRRSLQPATISSHVASEKPGLAKLDTHGKTPVYSFGTLHSLYLLEHRHAIYSTAENQENCTNNISPLSASGRSG
jgi:hypothetical protein